MEFEITVTPVDMQQIFGHERTQTLCVCDYDEQHVLFIFDGKKFAVPASQLTTAVTRSILAARNIPQRA